MGSVPTLSARKVRFNQFASVVYQQEPYMTPRDFLFSVMLENVDRKMSPNGHTGFRFPALWDSLGRSWCLGFVVRFGVRFAVRVWG